MTRAKIISFINMKGGVGKTSLSINLAFSLSQQNLKVLVVDTDPQFNSTQSLLLVKARNSNEAQDDEKLSADHYKKLSATGRTIMQIYDPTSITEPLTNPSLVQNINPYLDLIPGDLRLASTIGGDTSNKVDILEAHFEKYELNDYYDYIIIDCPPTWTILTHSSLYASNYYLIPSKIDLYSSLGIKLLEEQVLKYITGASIYKKTGKSLTNLGVLFTLVKDNNKNKQRRREIEANFDDKLYFFDADIPYFPSASTDYILYHEKKNNPQYARLNNSLDKFVDELKNKITELEGTTNGEPKTKSK